MRPVKFKQTNVGIGGNGYLDYGCTNDASRPSGWNSLYVRAGAAGNGTKASPFGTITQAIVAAGSTRTVVCVAGGNYSESLDLGMQRRQMLVGGLNSAFTARDALTTPTTVSAANANQHVMHAEAPAELVMLSRALLSHASGSELPPQLAEAWSAAVYRNDNRDDIAFVRSGVSQEGYFTNIDRTRRQGAELAVQGRNGAWDWMASYGYLDATYQSSGVLPGPLSTASRNSW